MRTCFWAVLVGVVALLTLPLHAAEILRVGFKPQSAGTRQAPPMVTPQPRQNPPPQNPFGQLFRPGPPPSSGTDSHLPSFNFESRPGVPNPMTPKPTIVCGMVVVPVDPHLDPQFVRVIPKYGVKGTMKIVRPPSCEGDKPWYDADGSK